jgi:hypothetical protein
LKDNKYLVTLGCCGAFIYIIADSIKEVEVTSINATTADSPDDNDDNVDIKKVMYSIVLHVV